MKPLVIYGIPNCDTVKAARKKFEELGLDVAFHNYRKDGVPADRVTQWLEEFGWTNVLNRSGTTWRRLDDTERESVVDNASARDLATAHDGLIRRPIVEWDDGTVTIGRPSLEARLG